MVPKEEDEIPSFDEWKAKMLREQEKVKHQEGERMEAYCLMRYDCIYRGGSKRIGVKVTSCIVGNFIYTGRRFIKV